MTDHELLKLAAKAANVSLLLGGWDPRTDDGDALRLAVKLKIDLRPSLQGRSQFVYAVVDGNTFAESGEDIYAATRRAIVRAAAEIGRTIP